MVQSYRLSLKSDETHFMQFTTKSNPQIDPDIAILVSCTSKVSTVQTLVMITN